MPAPTPQDYRGKRILQAPFDENRKPVPPLVAAITDPGTGLIVGYLPIKATDNGDGTATIKVDTEITIDGSITVGNVKVGSSDGQVSGDKWLKVLSDGTLIIDKTGLATELKQDTTNTKLDSVIAQLDVTLSSRASEVTLLAVNVTLGNILTALTGLATEATLVALNSKDFATQTTLVSVKTKTDLLNSLKTAISTASLLDTRLKVYEVTKNIADSPVTFSIKADMDTKYAVSDSIVRFLRLTATKDTSISINSDLETITLPADNVFILSDFNILTLTVNITADGTQIKLLAEGV